MIGKSSDLRAIQEKICHYRTSSDEIILEAVCLSSDRYILLLYNLKECQWTLMEKAGGLEQGRFHLRNLLPAEAGNSRRRTVSLFSISGSSFGILAADELFIWKNFRSKPRRVKLRMNSPEDLILFESNPVVFVRAMEDESLILAHRTVFSEAYFFSILAQGTDGYTFTGRTMNLNSHDYRHLLYVASVPCIMDILARGDSIYLHSPGSFRNWQKYPAEGSLLVQMNRQGGIIQSRQLETGRGIFSPDGNGIMIKPFESNSILYFDSLEEDLSVKLTLDEHAEWTPGTAETRYCVSDKRIAAWDRTSFILSAFYNMPDWYSDLKTSTMTAC